MQSLHQNKMQGNLLITKWNSHDEHARKRESEQGMKVVDPKSVRIKNTLIYVSMNHILE
jgi:hypothetical protein